MIDPFPIITVIAVAVTMVIGVLVWLVYAYLKLKRDYQVLMDIVYGNNNDIADLSSAVLTIDGRITEADAQINALSAEIAAHQHHEPSANAYSAAIQKARKGASVSELMQESGLSREEAALLIRLHGSKTHS